MHYKTHYCGDLRKEDSGQEVTARRLGAPPPRPRRPHLHRPARHAAASSRSSSTPRQRPRPTPSPSEVRSEYVLQVRGDGRAARRPGTENADLPTGEIEVVADRGRRSSTPPRRRPSTSTRRSRSTSCCACATATSTCAASAMHDRIVLRHRVVKFIRDFLDDRGFYRDRDADPRQDHAGGRARLPGAQPRPPGQLLRPAAVAAAVQAAADGRRLRALLPDRPLLPRRGPARRPPAGVHPARPGDELRRRRRTSST